MIIIKWDKTIFTSSLPSPSSRKDSYFCVYWKCCRTQNTTTFVAVNFTNYGSEVTRIWSFFNQPDLTLLSTVWLFQAWVTERAVAHLQHQEKCYLKMLFFVDWLSFSFLKKNVFLIDVWHLRVFKTLLWSLLF